MHRILTADDDLNDITQNGIYYYYTEDVPLNAPYENASIVEVFGANSDTTQKVQRVTRYGASGYTSERTLLSNEWLGWVQFVTNADLGIGFVSSGSLNDIIKSGVYYVSNNVTDKPTTMGGLYVLATSNSSGEIRVGLFAPNDNGGRPYIVGNGWSYKIS